MRAKWWCMAAGAVVIAGCSRSQEPAAIEEKTPPVPYSTSMTMQQVMGWVIDPSADAVWDSVGTIISYEGRKEIAPHTDEEWIAVRNHAAIVAESANLLMIPGRAFNQEDWMAKARALADAAAVAIQAAEVKDPEALFDAGGEIYQACSNCHAKYLIEPQASPSSGAESEE